MPNAILCYRNDIDTYYSSMGNHGFIEVAGRNIFTLLFSMAACLRPAAGMTGFHASDQITKKNGQSADTLKNSLMKNKN